MARDHDMESRSARHRDPAPPQSTAADDVRAGPPRPARVRYGIVPARPIKPKVPLGTRPGAGPGLGASGPGNFPDFLYRGGPVITNPQVHVIFVGDWTNAANQARAARLRQFIGDLLNSTYMNMLGQYGVGYSGAMAGSAFIAETNDSINDSDVQTLLQTAITNGTLPEPTSGSSICFMIYLDDNIAIADESVCEPDGAFGYHSHFQTTGGNPCYYGIVAGLTDACLTTACQNDDVDCNLHLSDTQEQRQTEVTSHELSEMITNPNVALSSTDTRTESWCQPLDAGSPHEAGDICSTPQGATTINVGTDTWTVQLMYSKWDDMNSNGATTCVAGSAFPLPSLLPVCTLVLDRSTFGRDEVKAIGAVAPFRDALYLVLDGFTPDELGLTASNLANPPTFWAFAGSFAAVSASDVSIGVDDVTGVLLEDSSNFQTIQRITVPFTLTFTGTGAFNSVAVNPGFQDFTISAAVTTDRVYPNPKLSRTSETAKIELVLQADPFMSAGETWWLSEDMRVFTVIPAALNGQPPLTYSTTHWSGDPNTYIANLLTELNTTFTDPTLPNTPFTGILSGEDQSQLQLNGTVGGNPVYNFGLARVHLRGDTAMNVRVFFRLFISPSPDTDFDTSTTFREAPETDASDHPIPGTMIPLIGFPSSDMTSTIPFFASTRVDSTVWTTTHQSDPSNVQTIPSPFAPATPAEAEVVAYFGCYLDINQTKPAFPLNPANEANANGPWPEGDLSSINQIIMSNHACLVAEVAYDPDPIPPGANAATSDKIGQRNLTWAGSDNPGAVTSHRIPTLFDLKPTANLRPTQQLPPDELMIDWGNTPKGTAAAIYFPQVGADDILGLAQRLYSRVLLRKQDANTIACRTGSVTYVPIPPGTGQNFAGLLTVDLGSALRTGQQFEIIVKRITSTRRLPFVVENANDQNWRYVVGAFQINIPVTKAEKLLPGEERLLAVFKWKLEHLPASNRWYPVLQRYVDQIGARVDGFGGHATSIPASAAGYPARAAMSRSGLPPGDVEFRGKVTGLIYDRFGDFEGFTMKTERGAEERFRCNERAIEELMRRAWLERYVIVVITSEAEPHVPVSIVTRR